MPDLSMSQQQQQYFNETWQTHETQYKVKKIEKNRLIKTGTFYPTLHRTVLKCKGIIMNLKSSAPIYTCRTNCHPTSHPHRYTLSSRSVWRDSSFFGTRTQTCSFDMRRQTILCLFSHFTVGAQALEKNVVTLNLHRDDDDDDDVKEENDNDYETKQ